MRLGFTLRQEACPSYDRLVHQKMDFQKISSLLALLWGVSEYQSRNQNAVAAAIPFSRFSKTQYSDMSSQIVAVLKN
jgi:hypothetical protein